MLAAAGNGEGKPADWPVQTGKDPALSLFRENVAECLARVMDVPEQHANIGLADSSARLETVRSTWREVLGVSEVEEDVSFLDAGGNSLLLVALVEQLSDACGAAASSIRGCDQQ